MIWFIVGFVAGALTTAASPRVSKAAGRMLAKLSGLREQ